MDAELKAYLDIVKQTVRPTLEEEKELAELIMSGRKATAYLLKLERKHELGLIADLEDPHWQDRIQDAKERIQKGENAKQRLVIGHLGLAAHLVRQYEDNRISEMDQLQEANVMLLWAAENWNCSPEEARFFSYAGIYVESALKNIKAKKPIVYIPIADNIGARRVHLVSKIIKSAIGQEATPERIAAELNIPLDAAQKFFEAWQALDSISLDEPLTNGDEEDPVPLSYIVPTDPAVSDPAEIVSRRIIKRTVAAVLATLEPVEEKVIRCRFGFVDGNPHEPEEVAHACGMSHQEEQLVEVRAIRRLRHPSRSQQLVGLL